MDLTRSCVCAPGRGCSTEGPYGSAFHTSFEVSACVLSACEAFPQLEVALRRNI